MILKEIRWWRRSLAGISFLLVVVSAYSLLLEHSFEMAPHPTIRIAKWVFCINVAKICAFLGYVSALFGKGWIRIALFSIGIIETCLAWPLGTFG